MEIRGVRESEITDAFLIHLQTTGDTRWGLTIPYRASPYFRSPNR